MVSKQGGELQVLRSINWHAVTIDVLCIETDPTNRPPAYAESITAFLSSKGYKNNTMQMGRNICTHSYQYIDSIVY